ncbi:MAG: hypothetical protein PVH15_01685 [Syntrophobacterales bacterium]|jgi:hypothetical protein
MFTSSLAPTMHLLVSSHKWGIVILSEAKNLLRTMDYEILRRPAPQNDI